MLMILLALAFLYLGWARQRLLPALGIGALLVSLIIGANMIEVEAHRRELGLAGGMLLWTIIARVVLYAFTALIAYGLGRGAKRLIGGPVATSTGSRD